MAAALAIGRRSACGVMLVASVAFGLAQLSLFADQAPATVSNPARPCRVYGRATSNAVPLPGVSVVARADDKVIAVTSTDQDGTYALPLPYGAVTIHFELTAFTASDRQLSVSNEICDAPVDVALALAPHATPGVHSSAAPARAGGETRTASGGGRAGSAPAVSRFEALSVRESESASIATPDTASSFANGVNADDPATRLLPPGFSPEGALEAVAVSGSAVALDRGLLNERIQALDRGEFGLADGQLTAGAGPGLGGGRGEGAAGGPGGGGRGGFGGAAIGGRGIGGASRLQASATYGTGGSAFNAAPFSLRGETPSAADYLQQSFSTTIGGPLKIPHLYDGTRRTTFNFSYSGGRNGDLFDQYATVPDAAFRAGDFSASRAAIIDPLTGQPFPDNRIPASRLDPSALALLGFIPMPTLSGATQNYRNTTTSHSATDAFSLRLTHSITAPPANAGRGRGAGGARGGGAGPGGRGTGGRGNAASPLNVTMNVGVNYRANDGDRLNVFPALSGTTSGSTLSIPVTVNARYGRSIHVFSATINRTASTTLGGLAFTQDVAGDAGIHGVATSPFDWGVPTLTFGSLTSVRDITPAARIDRSLQLGYTWTRPAGSHTFRAGGTFQQQHNQTQSDANARGSYTFTGLYTANGDNVVGGSGQDFADFLLGLPQQATRQYSVSLDNISSPVVINGRQFGLYVQDDWRWKARWTINYGLQYDVMLPFTEANGHMVNLDAAPDFSAVAPVLAGGSGPFSGAFPDGLVKTDWNNLAPRVGVAWRANNRSVVRFGYGLGYNSGSYANIARQLYQQPPFFLTGTSLGSLASPLTLSDAFVGIAPSTVTNNYGIDENYQLGQIHQWNADYSRDLFRSWVVGATYIGTRGSHLDMLRAPNRGPDGLRISGVQAFTWQSSEGSSYMNGVSFRVQKRQTRGISGSASYTLSKSRDNTTATGGNATVAQDDQDLNAEWALSNFDRRHQFNGNISAELPWGKNRPWLADGGWFAALVGDWSMSANLSWLSGTPLTVRCSTCASDVAQGIGGTLRADYTGLPIALDHPTIDEFFNTAAFAIPVAGTFGNSLRNVVIGPGSHQLNAQFTRDVAFGAARTMSINVNVTNLLNAVMLGTVDTNVNSPTFGQVLSVRGMRTARLNIRFRF